MYSIEIRASEIGLEKIGPPAGPPVAALPYDSAAGSPIAYVCDGEQLGVLQAPEDAPIFRRVARSGDAHYRT